MRAVTVFLGAGVLLAGLQSAGAATITLDSGSDLTLEAGVVFNTQQSVTSVNTIPYVTPDTFTYNTSSGTVTPSLSSDGFSFTDADETTQKEGLVNDAADIYFTPGPGTAYTLFGSSNATAGETTRDFNILLEDETTGLRLYASSLNGAGTLTFDPNRAGYSGVLTAGDRYDFSFGSDLSDSLGIPESQVATVGITFVVPEPATAGAMLVIGSTLLLRRRAADKGRQISGSNKQGHY